MAILGKQKKWPQLELAAYMNDPLKWRVEKEFFVKAAIRRLTAFTIACIASISVMGS